MPPVQVRLSVSQVVGTCGRLRVSGSLDAAYVRGTREERRSGRMRRRFGLEEGREEESVRLRCVRAVSWYEVFT